MKQGFKIRNFAIIVAFVLFIFSTFFALHSALLIHAITNCQTNATTPRVTNGLISTPNIPNGSLFSNTTGNCVTNTNQAALPSFEIPTYEKLKAQFFDFNPLNSTLNPLHSRVVDVINSSVNQAGIMPNLASNDGLMWVKGDLTITSGGINDSGCGAACTGTGVIFVDGNLYINGNITYGEADNKGLVFIVGGCSSEPCTSANHTGGVYIDHTVTKVDAVLISAGNLCTSYDQTNLSTIPCPTTVENPPGNTVLTINGNIISIHPADPTNPTTTSFVQMRRSLGDNHTAAEVVNEQPKYLAILAHTNLNTPNLMTQTLTITTQDTNYAAGFPSATTATLNGPGGSVYTGNPYTLTWSSSPGMVSCNGSTSADSPANTWSATGLAPGGSASITPTLPGTYKHTITCMNAQGISGSGSTSVNVVQNPNFVTVTPPAGGSISPSTSPNVQWASASPQSGDLLALYTPGAPGSGWIAKLATNSCPSTANQTPSSGNCTYNLSSLTYLPKGTYEIRYVNNSFSTVLISNSFTINN